ncbi:MAG: ankyrin repeat domain-containing protein [Sneathiella sp.]
MAKREKNRESLQEILQSTSLTLFPAQDGKAVIKLNSRDLDGDTPLHILMHRGHNYGCHLLIEAGADVNAIGDLGLTALHYAIRRENEEMITLLLKAGARQDITCEFGETAIDIARRQNPALLPLFK